MSLVLRERSRVRSSEIGPDGAMRLPALLDLFQEAAGNSATDLGWASGGARRVALFRASDAREIARAMMHPIQVS
jgi:hypothetical protein